MSSFIHKALQSTLVGVDYGEIVQFRGIPYATIDARFDKPKLASNLPGRLDCTEYGPRCPQVPIDVGHLLRIPLHHALPEEPEDEFKCLNLDVTIPKQCLSATGKVPVMVWIHGGSQAMTFGSAASGVADMKAIVTDSVQNGKPIIVVAVQYRLNIFAFGDETSSTNLALQDQASALRWVQDHIAEFGGDHTNVTLAGESAGAVYCHAHVASGAPIKQCILSSGSLYLSPPQPKHKATAFREAIKKHLGALGDFDLRTAPVSQIIEAIKASGIQSWFLLEDPALENWESKTGNSTRLLITDVQNEAILWHGGVWATDTDAIVNSFDLAEEESQKLKQMYNIYPDRPSSCKIGALDFINDYKFVLPAEYLTQQWRAESRQAFRCLLDEANPWQPSNGAHHAIDLVLLFGGFDLSFSRPAQHAGSQMRKKWIEFIHSEDPWGPSEIGAFGPHGTFQQLASSDIGSRRRMAQVESLAKIDTGLLDKVFIGLAAGKISLLN